MGAGGSGRRAGPPTAAPPPAQVRPQRPSCWNKGLHLQPRSPGFCPESSLLFAKIQRFLSLFKLSVYRKQQSFRAQASWED